MKSQQTFTNALPDHTTPDHKTAPSDEGAHHVQTTTADHNNDQETLDIHQWEAAVTPSFEDAEVEVEEEEEEEDADEVADADAAEKEQPPPTPEVSNQPNVAAQILPFSETHSQRNCKFHQNRQSFFQKSL